MANFASNFLAQQLLKELGYKIDKDTIWTGKDKAQQKFVDYDFGDLKMPEIEGMGQIGGTNLVKEFLMNKGIPLDLPDEIDFEDICAAVVLDIKSTWKVKGKETKIPKPNMPDGSIECYDGAKLKGMVFEDRDKFKFSKATLTNGDYVIFEQKSNAKSSVLEIEENGRYFAANIENYLLCKGEYVSFSFPQVDLDTKRDIDELLGVKTSNIKDYKVTIAKGRCLLQLNHIGAKLKMAMGGVAVATSFRPEYNWEIDDTFCVHFCRDTFVYASVLVTPEFFKKVEIDFDEDTETDKFDETDIDLGGF